MMRRTVPGKGVKQRGSRYRALQRYWDWDGATPGRYTKTLTHRKERRDGKAGLNGLDE